MSSDIVKALNILCEEKGLEYEVVMEALESALAAAYRKDFGNRQGNYKVQFDPETGDMKVWDVKEVVADIDAEVLEKAQEALAALRDKVKEDGKELTEEEIGAFPHFNPKTEIMVTEAKSIDKKAAVGDILEIDQPLPSDFGRMAAQTAKQVIIQKLREAERNSVFDDFKTQEGQIIQGIVQRRDRSGAVIVDLGKITGIVLHDGQIQREQYRPGMRMKFYVVSVGMSPRGPEIILSRADKRMVEVVFAQEIPEIGNGEVQIKAIARDPGNRSKVAVWTDDESIDPIGSCIGQRGSRITTIIDELGGEKIDVIQWSDKTLEFIKHALSPAKVSSVELEADTNEANVHVAGDQFSLAIGRGGQNVRLAAELTGWKINVLQEGNADVAVSSEDDVNDVEKKLEDPADQTEDDGMSESEPESPRENSVSSDAEETEKEASKE